MESNKFKCWMLQLKQSNVEHKYELGEEWLESNPAERTQGVLVVSRLDLSQWYAWAVQRANLLCPKTPHKDFTCNFTLDCHVVTDHLLITEGRTFHPTISSSSGKMNQKNSQPMISVSILS